MQIFVRKSKNQTLLTFSIYLLLVVAVCKITATQPTFQTYMVQFTKITQQDRLKLDPTRQVISQMDFLLKQVNSNAAILKQGIFFVKYKPYVNASKSQKKNQQINKNVKKSDSEKNDPRTIVTLNQSKLNNTVANKNFKNLQTNQRTFTISGRAEQVKPINKSKQQNNSNSSSKKNENWQQLQLPLIFPPTNNTQKPIATQISLIKQQSSNSSSSKKNTGWQQLELDLFQTKKKYSQYKQYPQNIVNTEFPGIGLYSDIPTTFVKNEVFLFRGRVTNLSLLSEDYSYVFIFLTKNGVDLIRCYQRVTKKKYDFDISCQFNQTGVYSLSIFVKERNFVSLTPRNIINPPQNITVLSKPKEPKGLNVLIDNGDLFITWRTISPLSRISFFQDDQSVSYLLSNFHQKFKVPYADFISFRPGPVRVQLLHAQSEDGTYFTMSSLFSNKTQFIFKAVTHNHIDNRDSKFQFQQPIPQKLRLNQKQYINVKFLTHISNIYYTVSPLGLITKKYFNPFYAYNKSSIIKMRTPLLFSITFDVQGPNIIQINEENGLAVINQPVYVGDCFPFLPDYWDILMNARFKGYNIKQSLVNFIKSIYVNRPEYSVDSQPQISSSLEQKRNFLLNLANLLRITYKSQPIYLDEQLNRIAQDHCEDMKKNNYFSHTNLKEEGPGQRAQRAQFTGAIGQNLSMSPSMIEAHLSLSRSASHFQNTINQLWTRVGIGICRKQTQQYIIVYEFSQRDLQRFPPTQGELSEMQKQMVTMIQRKYNGTRKYNEPVSNLILQWMKQSFRIKLLSQYLFQNKVAKTEEQIGTNCRSVAFYRQFVASFEGSVRLRVIFNHTRPQFAVNLAPNRTDSTRIQYCFAFLG